MDPYPHRYRVTTAEGKTRSGTLDHAGFVRIEGIDPGPIEAMQATGAAGASLTVWDGASTTSVTSVASETRTPSPTPGKMNALLPCPITIFRPSCGILMAGLARPSTRTWRLLESGSPGMTTGP